MVKRKKKKKINIDKKWRREAIAEANRRGAEWEKERRKKRWRIWRSFLITFGILLAFYSLIVSLGLFDIPNTLLNLILGLTAINGTAYWGMRFVLREGRNVANIIPFNGNPDYFCYYSNGDTYHRELSPDEPLVKKEYFSHIDDKKIVIDNDGARIFTCMVCMIPLLYLWFYAGYTPSRLLTEDYFIALMFSECEVLAMAIIIITILQPRHRIVFNRVSKTVTIPARLFIHKEETIPYSQAALTVRIYKNYKMPGYRKSIMILNSCSRSLFGAVTLLYDGDIDEAIGFARFIQIYMEEEIQDMSKLEKYWNKEKQQQEETEYFNTW